METALCVTSLDELIVALEEHDLSEYPKILKSMEIPASNFDAYKTWNDEEYTRNCIIRSTKFELLLLCWNEGQKTPIHGHDGQQCWVYQVDGEVKEIRYQKDSQGDLKETNVLVMQPGDLSYMHDSMGYHILANATKGKACTLHVYMLPIDNCEYFCEKDEVFKEKPLAYDS